MGNRKSKKYIWKNIKRYYIIYILLILPMVYLCVYRYYPIILQFLLAFKNYRILDGPWRSAWVGLDNFREIFSSPNIVNVLINTLRISTLRLVAGFLPPLILALMIFDLSSNKFRKFSQTVLYIPHFFSWVIIYAIVFSLFTKSGIINGYIANMGGKPQDFLIESKWFMPLLIGSGIWKELGWGTIIYMAALTNINTELFDAAKIDGAGPLKRLWYISLPGILPVVVFILTISLGTIFTSTGTEQILLFYTPATYKVADVVGTWIFRQGLGKLKYSLGASVGLFQSVIGLTLVLITNKLSTKFAGVGIW